MLRLRIAMLLVVAVLSSSTRAAALTRGDLILECPELENLCVRPTTTPTPGPSPSHTPVPTPTPRRTPEPIPCEGLGYKTLEIGRKVTMCFTVSSSQQGSVVSVGSINLGNAQCGSVEMEMTTPSGHKVESLGAQPGAAWSREVGKWYVWVRLQYGCNRYKFYGRLDNIDLK